MQEKRIPGSDLDALVYFFVQRLAASIQAGPIELHAMATAQEAARAVKMRETDLWWLLGRMNDESLSYVRGLSVKVPDRLREILAGTGKPFNPNLQVAESEAVYRLRQKNTKLNELVRSLRERIARAVEEIEKHDIAIKGVASNRRIKNRVEGKRKRRRNSSPA